MKKMFVRRCSLVLAMVLLIASIQLTPAFAESKDDNVMSTYWPYSSWAVQTGMKYKLVQLDNAKKNVKRWEVANIIYLMLGDKESSSYESNTTFSDLNQLGENIEKRVRAVTSLGIISGYSDKTFKPYNNVTRAEFVTLLDRVGIIKSGEQTVAKFNDTTSHWAKKSINKIVTSGIMQGKSSTLFKPNDSITVEEILAVLDRLCTKEYLKEETVISIMTGTFKCRQYGNDEAYIVEEVYGKFDEIQWKMNNIWFLKEQYDNNKWNEMVKYEDMLKLFAHLYEKSIRGLTDKVKSARYEGYVNDFELYMQISGRELPSNYRNSELSLSGLLAMTCLAKCGFGVDATGQPKFSNYHTLSELDKKHLSYCVMQDIMPDSIYEYDSDLKVTKYMLNYIIVQLVSMDNSLLFNNYYDVKEQLNFDASTMPKNRNQLTYVIKGIPNWVYEKPLKYAAQEKIFTPRDMFAKTNTFYAAIYDNIKSYYDYVLNVDYRTMNVEKFIEEVKVFFWDYNFTTNEREIRNYAQYVIDNKIILKGSCRPVYGFIYVVDLFAVQRVMLDFEIVHSNTNIDVLLGDSGDGVKYDKKQYSFCVDSFLDPCFEILSGNIYCYKKNYATIFNDEKCRD